MGRRRAALIARSSDGDFTILPQHTATVGDIVPGIVRVDDRRGRARLRRARGLLPGWSRRWHPRSRARPCSRAWPRRLTDIDVARAQTAKDAAEAQLAGDDARRGDATPSTYSPNDASRARNCASTPRDSYRARHVVQQISSSRPRVRRSRALTTSPMETTPTTLPSSTTGM